LWLEYTGDIPVKQIDAKAVQGYFVWLRTEYQSRQVAGRPRPLAPKTIRDFHITLSAFFTWASREFEIASPMKAIPVPKYEEPPVEPFTKEQIEALLKACESCKEAQPIDRRKFTMRRATGRCDQAVILTLLDTGLRASELSALKVGDVSSGWASGGLRVRIRYSLISPPSTSAYHIW
jgi:integrase